MNMKELQTNAERAADLLRVMGNEKRLHILCRIGMREISVGDLEPLIGLSQSALSQHLAVLREKNLVKTRRESQQIFYSLADPAVVKIIETLHSLYCDIPVAQSSSSQNHIKLVHNEETVR